MELATISNLPRKESSMNAKRSWWKYIMEENIYIVSKYFPTKYLLIIKWKNSKSRVEKLGITNLIKWSKLISPVSTKST